MKPLFLFLLVGLLPGVALSQSYADSLARYRSEQLQHLLADPRQPVDSASVSGLQWFEPQPHYRVWCRVVRLQETEPEDLPTYSGRSKTFRPWARLFFTLEGEEAQLTVYQSVVHPSLAATHTYLFLPFKDATNGESTYGGGRYIDLQRSELEGDTWLLDFNRAYNPLCAYSDGFNCPIPPRENHLEQPIPAGERQYTGPYKSAE